VDTPTHSPRGGGYGFPFDPQLRADVAPPVWLPQLDPATVLLTPAPEGFTAVRSIGAITPVFRRRADEGEYWIVGGAGRRLPILLLDDTTAATPMAAVIPFDETFPERADATMRLWRIANGEPQDRALDQLTQPRRHRFVLTFRALDAHLTGETYRGIAQNLFDRVHIPLGRGWKTHDLRDRTIRLVRTGLKLMRGGYLKLLRYSRRRRRTRGR
jgi:hypothetical protein